MVQDWGSHSLPSPSHKNEDRVIAKPSCYVDSKGCVASLFAVLDGHGGEEIADFIAEHIVATLFPIDDLRIRDLASLDDSEIGAWLKSQFAVLDETAIAHARTRHAWSGCCACVAILCAGRIHIANLGDCRAILLSQKKKVLKRSKPRVLSSDHQPLLETERKRIEGQGGWIDATGRVLGVLACSRSFGDREFKHEQDRDDLKREKGLDVLKKMRAVAEKQQQNVTFTRRIDVTAIRDPLLSPEPDVSSITVDPARHGALLLASDGVWDFCSNSKASALVAKARKGGGDWNTVCSTLTSYARHAETGENKDDISVLIVQLSL
jgi:serine/threonine protein phosphatase PrpC